MPNEAPINDEKNTKEEVAFKLVNTIVNESQGNYKSKEDILRLYAECLIAARDPQGYLGGTYKNILAKANS